MGDQVTSEEHAQLRFELAKQGQQRIQDFIATGLLEKERLTEERRKAANERRIASALLRKQATIDSMRDRKEKAAQRRAAERMTKEKADDRGE
jgi:hypothetical protein